MSRRAAVNAIKFLAVAAALAFLAYAFWNTLRELSGSGRTLRWRYLVAAAACCFGFFLLQAFAWRVVLSKLGAKVSPGIAFSTWFSSQAAKYVPGKVMLPLVRVTWGSKAGAAKSTVVLSILVEVVLMTVSSVLVFLALLPFLSQGLENDLALAGVVVCGVLGLIAIHPRLMNWGVNLALRMAKRDPVRWDFSYRILVPLLLVICLGWLLFGASGLFCVRAVGEAPAGGAGFFAAMTAGFAISWAIGFLSFVTPGGLGVREGALTLILSPFLTTQTAMAVALLSRLAWMAAEAVGAAVFFHWRPRSGAAP